MKPFLGIDLTTNSKNEQTIGNEFLIKKTPAELTLKIQMQANKMDTTMHKSHNSTNSSAPIKPRGIMIFFCEREL